jgi:hypothetical protein
MPRPAGPVTGTRLPVAHLALDPARGDAGWCCCPDSTHPPTRFRFRGPPLWRASAFWGSVSAVSGDSAASARPAVTLPTSPVTGASAKSPIAQKRSAGLRDFAGAATLLDHGSRRPKRRIVPML